MVSTKMYSMIITYYDNSTNKQIYSAIDVMLVDIISQCLDFRGITKKIEIYEDIGVKGSGLSELIFEREFI